MSNSRQRLRSIQPRRWKAANCKDADKPAPESEGNSTIEEV